MAFISYSYPATAASGLLGTTWANPTRVTADDGLFASQAFTSSKTFPAELTSGSYDFDNPVVGLPVPDNAAIEGIELLINHNKTGAGGTIKDGVVRLTGLGGTSSNLASAVNWSTSDPTEVYTYGGPSVLWGFSSLTGAIIKNVGVYQTVNYTYTSGTVTALVDYHLIGVYWSLAKRAKKRGLGLGLGLGS